MRLSRGSAPVLKTMMSACDADPQSSTTCSNHFQGEPADADGVSFAGQDSRSGVLLLAPWGTRIRRAGSAVRADGKGPGPRASVGIERGDARRHRRVSV